VHPLTSKRYDAVVLHGGGGRVSPDLNVKVFKYLDESDLIGQATAGRRLERVPAVGDRRFIASGRAVLALDGGARASRSGMRPVEGAPAIGGPRSAAATKATARLATVPVARMKARTVDARSLRSAACRRIRC
jgi:hypothetical protein